MLKRLVLQHFRNIQQFSMDCDPRFNVICGANGSGKTALLEAIYFLSHGRSFRASKPARIVTHEQREFSLFTEIDLAEKRHKIGLSRSIDGENQLKIDGKHSASHTPAAKLIPALLFNPESFSQFWQGSKMRRSLMDWGLFYDRGEFLSLWQDLSRNLKQRNSALKQGLSTDLITLWDESIISLAEKLDQARAEYVEAFFPIVDELMATFLPDIKIGMSYHRGWSKDKTLADCLSENLDQDRKLGYTYHGPHRADIRFRVGQVGAQEVLSRGQQKLLICALKLAQGVLFEERSGQSCLYLLDDLCSELDAKNRQKLFDQLLKMRSQVFVTIIEPELIEMNATKIVDMSELAFSPS